MIIYKITNTINGKAYIGQTSRTVKQRFNEHAWCRSSFIGRAIHKYGRENFTIEILEKCETLAQANEREKYYVKFFNCKSPNGYNLTDGGEGTQGYIPSEITLAKRSAAMKGRKFSAEHRAKLKAARNKRSPEVTKKIADKNRGSHRTEEQRARVSAGAKKRAQTPEGRAHLLRANQKSREHGISDETRAKISASSKGRRHTAEAKAKIGAAHRGKKLSEETKLKISMTKKKKRMEKHNA